MYNGNTTSEKLYWNAFSNLGGPPALLFRGSQWKYLTPFCPSFHLTIVTKCLFLTAMPKSYPKLYIYMHFNHVVVPSQSQKGSNMTESDTINVMDPDKSLYHPAKSQCEHHWCQQKHHLTWGEQVPVQLHNCTKIHLYEGKQSTCPRSTRGSIRLSGQI